MPAPPSQPVKFLKSAKKLSKLEKKIFSMVEIFMTDDQLARTKGHSPHQIEARKRVAKLFCETHLPPENREARAERLAHIDYALPIATVNGRQKNLANPKAGGLPGYIGLGRKPAYIISERFPPKESADPIYALEYFPHKKAAHAALPTLGPNGLPKLQSGSVPKIDPRSLPKLGSH